jgi:electron transfer flavoprotein beta subunit
LKQILEEWYVNIIVCVKLVPDIEGIIKVKKGTNSIQENGVNYVTNPLDLIAVEWAVRIKEALQKGNITLISLGTPLSEQAMREGLAVGADNAFLVCDPALDRGDSYATAFALARAISRFPYDLIMCGRKADDTQSGLVGAYIARILDIPLIQDVIKIDIEPETNNLITQRKLPKGNREIVKCCPPVLLTTEHGLIEPRYPAVRAVMKAKKQKIEHLDLKQLGLSPNQVGIAGSKVKMRQLGGPKPKMKGLVIPDSKLTPAERLRIISAGGVTKKESRFLEGDPPTIATQIVQYLKQRRIIQ